MKMIRKLVQGSLKEWGITDIQEAQDGNEGWDLLMKSDPPIQLVISDWNMPNCTGVELLRRVRNEPKYAKIPFILLTAEAEVEKVQEAVSLGVSNYILKPFTAENLRTKLEAVHKKLQPK
jgi:two-component system chemotaxis response regulator CheY